MTHRQHVLHGGAAAGELVGEDRGQAPVRGEGVDQQDRHLAAADVGEVDLAGAHGCEDQGVHLAVEQVVHSRAQPGGVAGGVHHQQQGAFLPRQVVDAGDHRPGEGLDGDLVCQEPDRAGLAEPQALRCTVRPVVEVGDGGQDAVAGRLADLPVTAVEDQRDGGRRHASSPAHIGHRWPGRVLLWMLHGSSWWRRGQLTGRGENRSRSRRHGRLSQERDRSRRWRGWGSNRWGSCRGTAGGNARRGRTDRQAAPPW